MCVVSTLAVVAEILREVAPRALTARAIVERAAGRLPTASRTPETVVRRDLALDLRRNGTSSIFCRIAPGEYLLRETFLAAHCNEPDDVEIHADADGTAGLLVIESSCDCLGYNDSEQLRFAWTGPRPEEVAASGMLFGRVPGDRWPYGPPSMHESCCNLFPHRGSPGGLFCDCAASAADDVENGVGA
jgi:hypothetical protein